MLFIGLPGVQTTWRMPSCTTRKTRTFWSTTATGFSGPRFFSLPGDRRLAQKHAPRTGIGCRDGHCVGVHRCCAPRSGQPAVPTARDPTTTSTTTAGGTSTVPRNAVHARGTAAPPPDPWLLCFVAHVSCRFNEWVPQCRVQPYRDTFSAVLRAHGLDLPIAPAAASGKHSGSDGETRKRGRPPASLSGRSADDAAPDPKRARSVPTSTPALLPAGAAVKRGPGRPRKYVGVGDGPRCVRANGALTSPRSTGWAPARTSRCHRTQAGHPQRRPPACGAWAGRLALPSPHPRPRRARPR